MLAEKPAAACIGCAANRTEVNVTATSSTHAHAHALLRYGRMRKSGPGFIAAKLLQEKLVTVLNDMVSYHDVSLVIGIYDVNQLAAKSTKRLASNTIRLH
jgi:hypothetical protein